MKNPLLFFILLTTVFIWTIPWKTDAGRALDSPEDGMLSKEELHQFLTMFTPGKVEKVPIATRPKKSISPQRPHPTPPTTSFLPTEVILPVPKLLRRKSSKGVGGGLIRRVEEPSATALLQQLNLLNSLLDSNEAERKTNEKVKALIDGFEKSSQTVPKVTPSAMPSPSQGSRKDLESLALLTSLLTSSNEQQNSKETQLDSPPALRATTDQEAANFVASLLLAQSPAAVASKSPAKLQDFSAFTNTQVNMDAAASNQLSGLLSLLGTIGSLSGGGGLLNLGHSQQQPSLLGLLGQGGGRQSGGLLGNMLGGLHKHQTRNTGQHEQFNALANLFAPPPAQNEPPGVVNSLVGLGSSVSTLLGQTFSGLRGTRPDGKPRVRGFDTRLGLGYRMGQNMDAQMMWEVGPQLFTQPLENEKRDTDTQSQAQMSPQLQKQLEELFSRNQQIQKRRQTTAAMKVEREHDELLRSEPSQYSVHRQIPPRQHRGHYQLPVTPGPFRPLPHYYMRPPVAPHPRYPLLAQVPGPAPVVRLPARVMPRRPAPVSSRPFVATRPTLSPVTVLNSRSKVEREDSYGMLTAYEKWLLKSAQGISKRTLDTNENGQWPLPEAATTTNRDLPRAPQATLSPQKPADQPKKIVRMTRKSEEPMREDFLMNRLGRFDAPQLARPPVGPYHHQYSPMPNYYQYHQRRRVAPAQRRFQHGYFPAPPPRSMYPAQYSYAAQAPPMPPPQNPYYNPHQNFIPESEDSFLRRNAIVTNPNFKNGASPLTEELGTKAKGTGASNNNHGTAAVSLSRWVEPSALLGGMFKKAIHNPVTRLLFPTTPLPPVDDHTGGVFNPTVEPVLVATPTATPLPSFFDHLGRPRPTKSPPKDAVQEEEESNPFIHIGEELSYKDLAETMADLTPRPRVRTYKNGTVVSKGVAAGQATSSERGDRPLNPPGMEMFIDIESGEVSVRKPIASLAHFGDLTTTPKPKTEDELEDEESLKIYERLQEHFTNSMNEFKLQQEIFNATREHKDKIRNEQDESLGLVNRYFDLLELDGGSQSTK